MESPYAVGEEREPGHGQLAGSHHPSVVAGGNESICLQAWGMILSGQVCTTGHPRSVTETRRIGRNIGQARITSPHGGPETWTVVMEWGKSSFPKRCVAEKSDGPSYHFSLLHNCICDSLGLCLCASHMPHLNSLGTRGWGWFFFFMPKAPHLA